MFLLCSLALKGVSLVFTCSESCFSCGSVVGTCREVDDLNPKITFLRDNDLTETLGNVTTDASTTSDVTHSHIHSHTHSHTHRQFHVAVSSEALHVPLPKGTSEESCASEGEDLDSVGSKSPLYTSYSYCRCSHTVRRERGGKEYTRREEGESITVCILGGRASVADSLDVLVHTDLPVGEPTSHTQNAPVVFWVTHRECKSYIHKDTAWRQTEMLC